MKVSLAWIADYVDVPDDVTPERLAHDLTMRTVEVESVEEIGPELDHVLISRVESVSAVLGSHALKLLVCDVGTDSPVQLVCAADNLRPDMLLPVAMPGARIRRRNSGERFTVAAAEVAGVRSEAVACAGDELGLAELFPDPGSRSIVDLTDLDCAPGAALAEAIDWSDLIIEIDNKSLTHRPDLWGHYGLAREIAAIYGRELKPLPAWDGDLPRSRLAGAIDETCNRLTVTRISGVTNGHAPIWMRSRLARVGQRPVSLLVDLTNYIMLEVGQPVHAFDAWQINLPLGVRRAGVGEELTLLDDRVCQLGPGDMLVADRERAVALAGVMGGLESSVSAATREMVLEIANFDATTVRRTCTRLGLRTEASARFEKALDTQRIDAALSGFLVRLKDADPQMKAEGFDEVCNRATERERVEVGIEFLHRRLGETLPGQEMAGLLKRVGFEVELRQSELAIEVPTWRSTGDVGIDHDILEEVARLHGYERFEFSPPRIVLEKLSLNRHNLLERRIREFLAFTGGMHEVVSYPWVEDRYLSAIGADAADSPRMSNPSAPNQSALRPSLIANLLKCVSTNMRTHESFGVFEVGRVFFLREDGADGGANGRFGEHRQVAGALVGTDGEALFYEAKGLLELLGRATHVRSLCFSESSIQGWSEPDARLGLEAEGRPVGSVGILSNRAKMLAGIKHVDVVVFELSIDALTVFASRENRYRPIPLYPEVTADLSMLVTEDAVWDALAGEISKLDPLIRDVEFAGQYRGEGVPAGKKSLTLRLHLGSPDRTLVKDEASKVTSAVIEQLEARLGAKLRSAEV